MTARVVLSNVTSFGLQVTVLVAAGAALARLFRLDEPRAMLAYWRTLLVVCLALPLCQPWTTVSPPFVPTIVAPGDAVTLDAGGSTPAASRSVTWPIAELVLIALAAGVAARALWLTIGAFSLQRLRRDAVPLDPLPESVIRAQEWTGAQAGVYVSDRVTSPITFGLLRPVVLFPPNVPAMPSYVQEAIACHELLHVRRRDWLSEVLEQAVRAVLWFHPAIWWLIGRIQLAREHVVDRAAVQLTESRERYVESLLAVALANSPTAFVPASSFLRRHLLKKRVARILQESTMTTRRLIASLTASAAALALAAAFAVRTFPLEAQGQAVADSAEPIQVVKGGEHLMHGGVPSEYPPRAFEKKIEGDVVLEMTLNDRGEVADARVLSGPEELRKTALEAALQWHYSPAALSSTTTQATLRFHLPSKGLKPVEFAGQGYVSPERPKIETAASPERTARQLMEIEKALEDPALTDGQRIELKLKHAEIESRIEKIDLELREKFDREEPFEVTPEPIRERERWSKELAERRAALNVAPDEPPSLVEVRSERVPEGAVSEILAEANVAIGDPITEDVAKRIRQAAVSKDEHFRVEFGKRPGGGTVVTILAR